jgi:putative phage-type endonuclease
MNATQGSAEWFAARVGKVTASRMADLCAKTKSGFGASRGNYMAELIVERLTGSPAPSFSSPAMQWGSEQEPNARAAYEFHGDYDVQQVGFIEHPEIDGSGASPDGMIGTDGLIEIKCPSSATHIDTLLSGNVPEKYVLQMHWQMACTLRTWCDYVSFDPRMPPSMQLFVKRIERDDKMIAELERNVRDFLTELECKVLALRTAYETQATLEAAA